MHRMAHADVFEIGDRPRFALVLFGGSGVDEEEYTRRSQTIIPVFEPVLQRVGIGKTDAMVLYVTAPYDVPLNRFEDDPTTAEVWNSHVLTELLSPWPNLPFFVSGFSAGAALALHGVHADARCFGGGMLGPDAIPRHFDCPPHWKARLRLYCARDDRVCNLPANQQIMRSLCAKGKAEVVPLSAGHHRLSDYCTADGLGDLIAFAARIASFA